MLYQNKTFTCPTSEKPMTDEAYEIAVGARCPDCKKKFGKTKHVCQKDQMELFTK